MTVQPASKPNTNAANGHPNGHHHAHVSTPGYAEIDVDPMDRANSTSSTPSMPATPERGPTVVVDEDEDSEDYDTQKPDPGAIVHPQPSQKLGGMPDTTKDAKRKSIPIRLEKTGKRGRFMLHADDTEVSDILVAAQQKKATGQRTGVRDLVFTRRFTTFDRQNPSSYDSPFHGFFTLFWIGMGLMLLRVGGYNWRTYGSVLGPNEIMRMMFSREVFVLGLSDAALIGSTSVGILLSKLCAAGYIDWAKSGWIIQNIWQAAYLGGWIGWTFYREWPWTHTIFLVLHCLVYVMKQHSYAFYNGYLSQVLRRKEILERKLKQLEATEPIETPLSSPVTLTRTESVSGTDSRDGQEAPSGSELRHRRKSSHMDPSNPSKKPPNLAQEPSDIAAIQRAITERQPITVEQMDAYSEIIKEELEALTTELKGKCVMTKNHYPANLTVANWAEWSCLPTLVYELEYPRQPHRNWLYIAEKTAATFGTLMIMMTVSQAYIYPSVAEAVRLKEKGASVLERWEAFPWILSDMLFPLLIEQLLTWYVIWECILNVLAETWRFADRGFYGTWWNSVSWDQYARDWNRPVHNFLLRHVYHSSISAFHLSRGSATFVTFLLSALVHELIMFCLFKKVRGYLFLMQLLQVPLIMLGRTAFMRSQPTLGNIIFWIGLFVGPSFLTSLYLVI